MGKRQRSTEPASNRAVLYLRRSKDDGPGSIPVQRDQGRTYARAHDLVLIEEIVDQESAFGESSAQRPGYQRALEMIRAGAAHHLIVWQLTRFGRDAVEILARRRELRQIGARLHSTSEDLTNTLLADILAVLAEDESRRLSERVTPRKRQLAAQGRFQSGRPPWGTVLHDGALLPGPRFAAVRLVFELAAAGVPVPEIARRVTQTFALDPPLHDRQTWRMLRNPAYVGVLRGMLPGGYGETKGSWDPLIPVELWQAARSGTDTRVRPYTRNGIQQRSWLHGLVICGQCGRPASLLQGSTWSREVDADGRRGSRRTDYYSFVCNGRCPRVRGRADWLEKWVAHQVTDLALAEDDAPLIRSLIQEFNQHQAQEADGRTALHQELARLRDRRDRVEELTIDGTISRERARSRLTELEAALGACEARLAMLGPPLHVDPDAAITLLTTRGWHTYRDVDPARYRAALGVWMQHVALYRPPSPPVIIWTDFARFVMARHAHGK